MKIHKSFGAAAALVFTISISLLLLALPVSSQVVSDKSADRVTLLVTAVPSGDRERGIVEKLEPSDFAVLENKKEQKILSVKKVTDSPMNVAVLIQDDLVSRVNLELPEIKQFITTLPQGSNVMVGYITGSNLQVREAFTTDLQKAADSLRILFSSRSASGVSPYYAVRDAAKLFEPFRGGKNMMLLISDGLDVTSGLRFGSPYSSSSLDMAIDRAQSNGVAVFAFYAPSVGYTSISRLAVNYGQGSLLRLANETGGSAFFAGMDFVTFDPYFKEIGEMNQHQWLITYQSSTTGKDFRKIEVVTDFDINLLHPRGYDPK